MYKILTKCIKNHVLNIFFGPLFSLNIFSQEMSVEELQSLVDLPDSIKNQISENQFDQQTAISSLEVQKANQEIQGLIEDTSTTDDEPFFGYSFFEPNNGEFNLESTVTDIPLQGDYLISLDDSLELLLSGNTNKNLKLRVDLSGNIFIPEIGSVSVLNLTLQEARKKVQKIINESYLGTDSFLSVKEPSLRKISVIGAVMDPGIYVVNPFGSIIDAIKYAGGLVENSSLRNITVRSFDGKENKIDLYDFLIFGNRDSNLSIKNGDTIVIGYTDKFVTIRGEVNNPNRYEYISEDTVEELLDFSGGINSYGDSSGLYVSFYENGKKRITNLAQNNHLPKGVIESILVSNQILDSSNEMIEVIGSAVRQGYYKKGNNLKDTLSSLEFSSNIYPFFALFQGIDKNGLSKISIPFSIADTKTQNIELNMEEVKLTFFERDEIYENNLNEEISNAYIVNLI